MPPVVGGREVASSSSSSSSSGAEVPQLPQLPSGRPYDLGRSTEDNYRIGSFTYDDASGGKFSAIRSALDYSYHAHYHPDRQRVQDGIVSGLLERTVIQDSATGRTCAAPCPTSSGNWAVFTAGAYGAGKTHTIRHVAEARGFPLPGFVSVDPDEIRRHLPEFALHVRDDAEMAGERTRKEAGYLSEVLAEAALREGRNVLVDGSLRDSDWYSLYFDGLRGRYSRLRIAILHVTAPPPMVFQNAEARSRVTGRVVPRDRIEMALEAVPASVRRLAPLVDFICELHNSPDAEGGIRIVTEGVTWEDFGRVWQQSCPREEDISRPRNKL